MNLIDVEKYIEETNIIIECDNKIIESRNSRALSIGFEIPIKRFIINNSIMIEHRQNVTYYKDKRVLQIGESQIAVKPNEFIVISNKEEDILVDVKKFSKEILNLKDYETLEYPYLKSELVEDYDGITTGKISIKFDIDQYDDFYLFMNKNNNINQVNNELSMIKELFTKKQKEIETLIYSNDSYDNTLLYKSRLYKIQKINHFYLDLKYIENDKIGQDIKISYKELFTNDFKIIKKDDVVISDSIMYKNNEIIEYEFTSNSLPSKFKGSKLESLCLILNLISNSLELQEILGEDVTKDMYNQYESIKNELYINLSEDDKDILDKGILYIVKGDLLLFTTDMINNVLTR